MSTLLGEPTSTLGTQHVESFTDHSSWILVVIRNSWCAEPSKFYETLRPFQPRWWHHPSGMVYGDQVITKSPTRSIAPCFPTCSSSSSMGSGMLAGCSPDNPASGSMAHSWRTPLCIVSIVHNQPGILCSHQGQLWSANTGFKQQSHAIKVINLNVYRYIDINVCVYILKTIEKLQKQLHI